MSKRYTARDLQAAFVEGAKLEYEALAKRFEKAFTIDLKQERTLHRGKPSQYLIEPFSETYNDRKDRRYAEAAKTYPVPQRPRVLMMESGVKFTVNDNPGACCNQFVEADGKISDRTINGWTPEKLRAMADLLEHPTEDAA